MIYVCAVRGVLVRGPPAHRSVRRRLQQCDVTLVAQSVRSTGSPHLDQSASQERCFGNDASEAREFRRVPILLAVTGWSPCRRKNVMKIGRSQRAQSSGRELSRDGPREVSRDPGQNVTRSSIATVLHQLRSHTAWCGRPGHNSIILKPRLNARACATSSSGRQTAAADWTGAAALCAARRRRAQPYRAGVAAGANAAAGLPRINAEAHQQRADRRRTGPRVRLATWVAHLDSRSRRRRRTR